MKTITVQEHEAASATPKTGMQSPRGKLNLALRGAVLCIALGLGAASLPALAETRVVIRSAPPAMQVEDVPAARHGYVWAPGYWRWQNRRHVWARGHWERERRGQRFEPARWEQRGDRYYFAAPRWQRDPNRSRPDMMRGGQRHGVQQ